MLAYIKLEKLFAWSEFYWKNNREEQYNKIQLEITKEKQRLNILPKK